MDERVLFISRLLEGERMTDLCQEFGISRKTGYKFRDRYAAHGVRGLVDSSRRPIHHPHHTPEAIEELIVSLRRIRPSWGPKKLRVRLQVNHPGVTIPAASTIGEILKRYEIPRRRSKRRIRKAIPTGPLRESQAPNEVWCVDYKGQFQLGNRRYCYPLTVSDHYSRYLLGCEALENTGTDSAWSTFEQVFQEHGLPQAIRSDNGTPFSSRGLNGWSRLSVWWLRLGIELERIEPGHPEQNGRHERMHLTLKQEATRPPSPNLFHQQARFDGFRHEYNLERPHEALDMRPPASSYRFSKRRYPKKLSRLEYPMHDLARPVNNNGAVYLYQNTTFYLSLALAGEEVGLREVRPNIWLVSFMDHNLGYFDKRG
jgi:transposase InsO family protein